MKEIKTLGEYNKFADYYDEIIRGEGYDLDGEVFFINELIENNLTQNPSSSTKFQSLTLKKEDNVGKQINILEFACGTGIIARDLEKKGYNIFGVDLSEEMIKKAKTGQTHRSNPTVEADLCVGPDKFIVGDMTSIDLEKEFDVVLCNYNSICHLHSWEDWQKFFKNSYKHLKKGGILIFDILTIFEFENITRDFRGFFNVGKDIICLEMFKEKSRGISEKHLYIWLIKMFINSGENNFKLVEEEIKEISFNIDDIKKQLENIGFEIKYLEDFHFGEVNDESERVYFVAQK